MDQPISLVFGAGLLILIIAFFLKRQRSASSPQQQQTLLEKQMERQEMEKTLQRFVQQVKQENELVVANLRKTKENLRTDLDQLEHRIHTLETELASVHQQVASAQTTTQQKDSVPAEHVEESAPKQEDALFLRERFQRVFDLQRDGLTVDEIAEKVGAGQGEIELIFSLHPAGKRDSP